jgi:hypothetical protein
LCLRSPGPHCLALGSHLNTRFSTLKVTLVYHVFFFFFFFYILQTLRVIAKGFGGWRKKTFALLFCLFFVCSRRHFARWILEKICWRLFFCPPTCLCAIVLQAKKSISDFIQVEAKIKPFLNGKRELLKSCRKVDTN